MSSGASMNDIKNRMKSVRGTMQITKAMELVATSKLRRAKESAEGARPYLKTVTSIIERLCKSHEILESAWTNPKGGKALYIVIAGDRGLAGGYNNNIFRMVASPDNAIFLPIGKKARDYYTHRGAELFSEELFYAQDISVGNALNLGKMISDAYLSGEISKVTLVFTEFKSMMIQSPTINAVLPLKGGEDGDLSSPNPLYEGGVDEILGKMMPEYLGCLISSAVLSSLASECAARRTAMNSANKNAEEMIDSLMLKFNRARQAVITQEITEIVSGAEAL